MQNAGFRKTNHRAVTGFLLPFLAMGGASAIVLWDRACGFPLPAWLALLVLVPGLLAAGLYFSITSIPLIDELGDKDYAYSGLALNVFLLLLFLFSILYYTIWIAPE